MNLFVREPRVIQLRPYQIDAVEKLRTGIRAGARRQVLVAPTAFGKTECAAHIIQQSQAKGATAWFICDRVSLIDQTSDRFSSYGIDHGVMQADHWLTDASKPVQVVSAQTLARRYVRDLPDLIIVDECHAQYDSVLKLVEKASGSKAIGLTATPFTPGMAEHWDGVVNGATVNKLLAEGYLSPLKVKACVAPDMKWAKKKFNGEYEEEEAGSRGVTIIGDVVQTWVAETRKAFGGPVKTIVFSPSVKHGAELCRQFADAGYNFQQISYLDASDDDRRAKINEFRRPDSAIHGLVSCAVLTKGFDVPDVMCGISCRPYTKSFSSHIQELGRVMRIHPGKEFGLWLDHSGNCISFADDTAWLFEYGVDSLSDAQKRDSETREPKEATKAKHFCGECGTQLQVGSSTCSSCGWERPQRGEIRIVSGDVVDVTFCLQERFEPRKGLRAACLSDPRGVWNAAISFTSATQVSPQRAKKWAQGIWFGIYPEAQPARDFFDAGADGASVTQDQWQLIEREVRRFRKTSSRRAA